MKTITIHYTSPYIGTIAKQGEHNQTELVFYLPDSFSVADFVNAEFVKRDGSTSVVDQLIPNNGTVSFPLTQDLTNVDGKMEIQLVAYKVDGTEITEIAKSGIYTCKIRKSLNVLYGQDQPGVIERILAFISYWAEKLPEMWAKKHWHDNKSLLDTITADDLGVKPDWNENDNTSKNYIRNRTHYKEETESQVTFTYIYNDEVWTPTSEAGSEDHAFPLSEGQEYKLTYNGTEYTFTGTLLGETSIVYIGNIEIADEEYVPQPGDFPFLFAYSNEGSSGFNNLVAIEPLQGETVSFSIFSEVITYHPISMNYLPAILGGFSTHEADTSHVYDWLEHDGKAIPQFPIVKKIDSTGSGRYVLNLYPYTHYLVGDKDNPVQSVDIYHLWETSDSQIREYSVEFYTGQYPTGMALPDGVHFVDGDIIEFEPYKHYQISVVNDIALWCSTDYLEEEEE